MQAQFPNFPKYGYSNFWLIKHSYERAPLHLELNNHFRCVLHTIKKMEVDSLFLTYVGSHIERN